MTASSSNWLTTDRSIDAWEQFSRHTSGASSLDLVWCWVIGRSPFHSNLRDVTFCLFSPKKKRGKRKGKEEEGPHQRGRFVCVYCFLSLFSFLSLANSLVSRRLSGYLILSFFLFSRWRSLRAFLLSFVFVLFIVSLLLLVLLYLSLPLSHLHGASRLIWITDEPTSAQYTHRFKLQVAYNTLDMKYFIIMKKKIRKLSDEQ